MASFQTCLSDTGDEPDEDIRLAFDLLRREIDDLVERAEALELALAASHLSQASKFCSLEVPDPQDH